MELEELHDPRLEAAPHGDGGADRRFVVPLAESRVHLVDRELYRSEDCLRDLRRGVTDLRTMPYEEVRVLLEEPGVGVQGTDVPHVTNLVAELLQTLGFDRSRRDLDELPVIELDALAVQHAAAHELEGSRASRVAKAVDEHELPFARDRRDRDPDIVGRALAPRLSDVRPDDLARESHQVAEHDHEPVAVDEPESGELSRLRERALVPERRHELRVTLRAQRLELATHNRAIDEDLGLAPVGRAEVAIPANPEVREILLDVRFVDFVPAEFFSCHGSTRSARDGHSFCRLPPETDRRHVLIPRSSSGRFSPMRKERGQDLADILL